MTLAIISGRSGSAKHIVLRLLENQGYYFIDKLPASLLQSLVNRAFNDETLISNVAVSIVARNYLWACSKYQVSSTSSEQRAYILKSFFKRKTPDIINRFSESWRKHSLSNAQSALDEATSKESE